MSPFIVVITATLTGIGLGTGFRLATAASNLTWGPWLDVCASEYESIVKDLMVARNADTHLERVAYHNLAIVTLAARPWVPCRISYWLLIYGLVSP